MYMHAKMARTPITRIVWMTDDVEKLVGGSPQADEPMLPAGATWPYGQGMQQELAPDVQHPHIAVSCSSSSPYGVFSTPEFVIITIAPISS